MSNKSLIVRKRENTKLQKAAVAAAVSIGAGVAAAVVSIACLAAFYGKTLARISYNAEQDVYEE